MASNFFGNVFRITTWGESHGPCMGVVIDGCPAGLHLSEEDIAEQLQWRQPGKNRHVTSRKEGDQPEIVSGVFQGKTTGATITILIRNADADSSSYIQAQHLYRPGHANFTYLGKYNIFDPRGGGRASARETVARVAAGAVALKLLALFDIQVVAYLQEMGGVGSEDIYNEELLTIRERKIKSPIFCPDRTSEVRMISALDQAREEGDSLGGIVACISKVPLGLGEPIYHKLEAALAYAMLSIPATKGFEIGQGFHAAKMKGSEHNDLFVAHSEELIIPSTNFAGGTLGGISTGERLYFRVAFKPTSSIRKPQATVSLTGEAACLQWPSSARHDPCVAIRGVSVVEAMTALVLADALLMNQTSNCVSARN